MSCPALEATPRPLVAREALPLPLVPDAVRAGRPLPAPRVAIPEVDEAEPVLAEHPPDLIEDRQEVLDEPTGVWFAAQLAAPRAAGAL